MATYYEWKSFMNCICLAFRLAFRLAPPPLQNATASFSICPSTVLLSSSTSVSSVSFPRVSDRIKDRKVVKNCVMSTICLLSNSFSTRIMFFGCAALYVTKCRNSWLDMGAASSSYVPIIYIVFRSRCKSSKLWGRVAQCSPSSLKYRVRRCYRRVHDMSR